MAQRKRHLRVVGEHDVDTVIANMRRQFMECRDWGHSWRAYTVSFERRGAVYLETLRCSRCYSRRHRNISAATGNPVKTHYTYSEGYLVPGWGRMSRDDKGKLRIAVLNMMLESHGTASVSVESE